MPRSNQLIGVIFIGVFVFIALGYGLYKVDRLSILQTKLIEASLEIGLEISDAHLHFHEALSKKSPQEIDQVWLHLETADRYALAILEGGRIKGNQVPESSDFASRAHADAVREDLTKLKQATMIWLGQGPVDDSLLSHSADCNKQFELPVMHARKLEAAIKDAVKADMLYFRTVQIALMALSLACAGWIIFWIRQNDRKQLQNFYAIEETKRNLEEETVARDEVQKELKEKERLLRATLESTADGILVVNSSGKTMMVNGRFIQIWKIPDDLLAERDDDKMLDFVLEQLENPREFMTKVRALYQSADEDTDTLHFKNGRVIQRYSCPLLEDKEVCGRVWSFRDITEQTNAEKALTESEESYRDTLKHLSSGILVHAADTTVISANPAACDLLGMTENRVRGMKFSDPLWQFVDVDNKPLPTDRIPVNQALATSEPTEPTIIGYRNGDNDEPRWLLANAFPLFDRKKNIQRVVMSLVDVTGLNSSEKKSTGSSHGSLNNNSIDDNSILSPVKAASMAATARMAGQIAHDYNNLLGPLVAYPELLKDTIPSDSDGQELLREMCEGAELMTQINQKLLDFGQRTESEPALIDLNALVELVIHENIDDDQQGRIITELSDELPEIKGSATKISTALGNLLDNAKEAIPDGGSITVTTAVRHLSANGSEHVGIPEGEYIELAVTDSGPGVPNSQTPNIFEPFYSTRQVDRQRGAGLGLSIAWAIMKGHNGFIDMKSRQGYGSTFYLIFPVATQAELSQAKPPADSPEIPSHVT